MAVDLGTLKSVPLFADADDAVLHRIAPIAERRTVPAGTELFKSDDPPELLYVPLRGRVALGMSVGEDDFAVLQIIGPFDPFGLAALLGDGPYMRAARALDDLELLCIEARPLKSMLMAEKSLTLPTLLTLARQHSDILEHAAALVHLARRTGSPEEPPTTIGDTSPAHTGGQSH